MSDSNDESCAIDWQLLRDLVVGIGEVSEITGIPQRKLRYWEDRDVIKSVSGGNGSTRRYDYLAIKKALLIKDMLDEGYTLEAADRQVTKRMQVMDDAFHKLLSSKEGKEG